MFVFLLASIQFQQCGCVASASENMRVRVCGERVYVIKNRIAELYTSQKYPHLKQMKTIETQSENRNIGLRR